MPPSKQEPNTHSQDDVELALLNNNPASKLDESSERSVYKESKAPNYMAGNNFKAISSCTLYSFCSVSMILVNKSLASR